MAHKEEQDLFKFLVRPDDSVSRVGSRRSSQSNLSLVSTSASSSKQAVARLNIQQLKMKCEILGVQNEIEQADLEARIYEDKNMNMNVSKSSPEAKSWLLHDSDKLKETPQVKPNFGINVEVPYQDDIRPLVSTECKEFTLPTRGIDDSGLIMPGNCGTDKTSLLGIVATIQPRFALPKPEIAV